MYDANEKEPNFKVGQTVLLSHHMYRKVYEVNCTETAQVHTRLWSVVKSTHRPI